MTTHNSGCCRGGQSSVKTYINGFTLVELLITIVVAGIILSVAVPQLNGYIHQNRFNGAVMDVLGAMRQARSTAVEKNANIVFKVDLDDRSYQAFLDNGAGSVDGDMNGVPDSAKNNQLDFGEEVVLSGILPDGVKFVSAAFGGNTHFHFDSRGFPLNDVNGLTNGLVALTGKKGSATIELIASGHSRIQ